MFASPNTLEKQGFRAFVCTLKRLKRAFSVPFLKAGNLFSQGPVHLVDIVYRAEKRL